MYPDYDRSILGVPSTLLRHYGAQAGYPSLPEIEKALERRPRNVVMFIIDGMGVDTLERHLPEDAFLRKAQAATISAVYPSTTTAATTGLYTGQSAWEHGWLGWSLYFKEYGRFVDAFMANDSLSGQPIDSDPANELMPLNTIYRSIAAATEGRVACHAVFHFDTESMDGAIRHIEPDFEGKCARVQELCAQPGEKFILCYHNDPDATMHKEGVGAESVRGIMLDLSRRLEALGGAAKDALVIVTADHGLVDVDKTYFVDEMPELMECLTMPIANEPRACVFYVRPDMRSAFDERFHRLLGDEFELIPRERAIGTQLFGRGAPHKKTLDFLGDYVACATGSAMLRFRARGGKEPNAFAAAHAGLREEEMRVPLILFGAGHAE